MNEVNFIRLWRQPTDSYLTVNLPHTMAFEKAVEWGEQEFKGFIVCSGCITNPDEIIK